MGSQLVEDAVRSWVPRVVGFRSGSSAEDRHGADFIIETPSSEIRVDAKYRRRDYRPLEDDVCLETWANVESGKVGWTRDRDKNTDLVVWIWSETRRTLVVPFRPLCETMIQKWKQWSTDYRTERHVTERNGDYWSSACVFVPLSELRRAMGPQMLIRDGIDVSHCEPASWRRFCRMPNCSQTAFYPCQPEKSLWCHRHWQESLSAPALRFSTTEAVREKKKASVFPVAGPTPPILTILSGGQKKLF